MAPILSAATLCATSALRSQGGCKTEDMVDTLTGAVAVYVTVENPIRPGDELFMDYGVQYWDSMGLARLSPQRLMVDYL